MRKVVGIFCLAFLDGNIASGLDRVPEQRSSPAVSAELRFSVDDHLCETVTVALREAINSAGLSRNDPFSLFIQNWRPAREVLSGTTDELNLLISNSEFAIVDVFNNGRPVSTLRTLVEVEGADGGPLHVDDLWLLAEDDVERDNDRRQGTLYRRPTSLISFWHDDAAIISLRGQQQISLISSVMEKYIDFITVEGRLFVMVHSLAAQEQNRASFIGILVAFDQEPTALVECGW